MTGQPSIFISYRSDNGGYAGRLYASLCSYFDTQEIFFDRFSIRAGDHLPRIIQDALGAAKVVLVLITPDWLIDINRRATVADLDFVRAEIEMALKASGGSVAASGSPKIIPVLLGNAPPPSLPALHETLRAGLEALVRLKMHQQGDIPDWDRHFAELLDLIAAVPDVPAPRYRPPATVAKPYRIIEHQLSPHFRDPRNFLGELRETLSKGHSAAIVVPASLYGMGGVGKTQLALKYTLDYREHYAGVWWFRAETD